MSYEKLFTKRKKILLNLEIMLLQHYGIEVEYSSAIDDFFKGDLDGETIYINHLLSLKEKIFNLLHLAGHTIQWNLDHEHFVLGSVLHESPDEDTLNRLIDYEWEGNSYGMTLLYDAMLDCTTHDEKEEFFDWFQEAVKRNSRIYSKKIIDRYAQWYRNRILI
jgi:hypothetical protein